MFLQRNLIVSLNHCDLWNILLYRMGVLMLKKSNEHVKIGYAKGAFAESFGANHRKEMADKRSTILFFVMIFVTLNQLDNLGFIFAISWNSNACFT